MPSKKAKYAISLLLMLLSAHRVKRRASTAFCSVSLMLWRSKDFVAGHLRQCCTKRCHCRQPQDALWMALRISGYDPRTRRRNEAEVLELQGRCTVVALDSNAYRDPQSIIVIDAKSLYDHLLGDQPGECGRCNLEVAVIKESLQICGGRVMTCALTKFPGAHVEPLIRFPKSHHYQVCDEKDTLAQGKQRLRRLKQGMNSSHQESNYLLGAVSTRSVSRNFPDVMWGTPLPFRP